MNSILFRRVRHPSFGRLPQLENLKAMNRSKLLPAMSIRLRQSFKKKEVPGHGNNDRNRDNISNQVAVEMPLRGGSESKSGVW